MRTKDERLKYCTDWKGKLDDQFAMLQSKRADALKFRDADPSIVAIIKDRSRVTTTDMQDAIDMAKPDILETVAGIDEPLKLEPSEAKWVEPVKKLQVLGNVMVKRKNKWFRICSDFLDDSMVLQFGCIKYRWIEDIKVTKKVYEGITDDEIAGLLQNPATSVVEDVISDDGMTRMVTIAYRTIDEYVRYDNVPSERIKFPLDTKDFAETPIVIEEVRLYEHEFVRDYGEKAFKQVKDIVESMSSDNPDPNFSERFKHVGGIDYIYDKDRSQYKAYECYFWEGMTPWVLTYSADVVLQDEENKYGKPPYRGGSPFLIAHALIGKGYYDNLREIQRERTFIRRQINDIITQNSNRRFFINIEGSGMNIDDYENNSAMNALVRFSGDIGPNNIRPEEKIPLGQDILAYWELLSNEKDAHIPTPRAYTGIEGAADESTYRGKQLKVNQASKKLLMMMRTYMEEVFGPLFQDTLDCIAKFMKKRTVVRYLDEDYEINPDEIICEYAMVVNCGLGSHDKEDLIVKLQQLIGLALQQVSLGIFTSQNFYYINSELVKAMGFLNTSDFVTDPSVTQAIIELVQTMEALLQAMAQVPQFQQTVMEMIPQYMQMKAKILTAMGVQPEKDEGGKNPNGTQEGQNTPAIQEQAAQPFEPQTNVSGGGFFA